MQFRDMQKDNSSQHVGLSHREGDTGNYDLRVQDHLKKQCSQRSRLEPILQFLAPWTVEAASLIRNCAGVVLGSEHTLHVHIYEGICSKDCNTGSGKGETRTPR